MSIEHIVAANGMLIERTVSERMIGNVFDSLRDQVLDEGVLVPQVLASTDVMFFEKQQILVSRRIPCIPMNTSFEMDSSHKVIWASFKEDSDTAVKMNIEWKCPEDMHLFLMGSGSISEFSNNTWNFYLVAVCEQGKKLDTSKQNVWVLPMPNQYDDGRMCFNVSLVNPREKVAGWADTFNQALELLSTARWAADPLFPEWKHTPAKKLFRWENKTGYAQLALPADISHWTKCCRGVSVTSLTNFFKQWSTAYDIKL